MGGTHLLSELEAAVKTIDSNDRPCGDQGRRLTMFRPMPPAPNTTTDSPILSLALFSATPKPVVTAHPNKAAASGSVPEGMVVQRFSLTTACRLRLSPTRRLKSCPANDSGAHSGFLHLDASAAHAVADFDVTDPGANLQHSSKPFMAHQMG